MIRFESFLYYILIILYCHPFVAYVENVKEMLSKKKTKTHSGKTKLYNNKVNHKPLDKIYIFFLGTDFTLKSL